MLTNREIAIIFWLSVLFIYALINCGTRRALIHVIRNLTSKIIIIVFTLMFIWVSTIVYILYLIGFWGINLIKDTIIWLIFTAFALLINSTSKALEQGFFKNKVIENITYIVLIEFIANTYTFNLIVEIVLIFLLALLGGLQAVAGREEKDKPFLSIVNGLVSILGIAILLNSIYLAIVEIKSFGTIFTIKSFLLPIILTILYLPFIYFLSLYVVYEEINDSLKRKVYIDKSLRRYFMRKILYKFNIKRASLRSFQKTRMDDLTMLNAKENINNILDIHTSKNKI